jgi:hypothetical protein
VNRVPESSKCILEIEEIGEEPDQALQHDRNQGADRPDKDGQEANPNEP